jgi:hypothetical protein
MYLSTNPVQHQRSKHVEINLVQEYRALVLWVDKHDLYG